MRMHVIDSTAIVSRNVVAAKRRALGRLASIGFAALAGLIVSASSASAYDCTRNRLGAGCISSRGAVGINKNGLVAVGKGGNVYAYRRGSRCYWRNNQRVCP